MNEQQAFFVTNADVVERSLRGQPWGTMTTSFRFGTASVQGEGLSPSQSGIVLRRYGALSQAARGLRVAVVRAAPEGFRTIDTRGWTNTMALAHDEESIVVVGRDFVSRVDLAARAAVLATPCEDDDFISPFENTLRVVAAYECLARGGMLLHCAGLLEGGAARICFGPSGIGKSTLATTWLGLGERILSDELCAVERDGDAFVVEQLPFAGDVASSRMTEGRFPLAGLHRLAQGPVGGVEKIPAARAVGMLLSCTPFVNADRLRMPALLDVLESVVATRGVTRLTLPLGADPRTVLRSWGAT